MKGTDSISIYTSLQLAVLDEFSDVTYSIRGKALTAKKDGNGNAERAMKVEGKWAVKRQPLLLW